MVEIIRGHDRNRPQTICRITASGRKRYLEYLATLEQVVRDAAGGAKPEAAVCDLLQSGAFESLKFFASITLHCKVNLERRTPLNDAPMFQSAILSRNSDPAPWE